MEKKAFRVSGWFAVLVMVLLLGGLVAFIAMAVANELNEGVAVGVVVGDGPGRGPARERPHRDQPQ